jgi:hypothetical protein
MMYSTKRVKNVHGCKSEDSGKFTLEQATKAEAEVEVQLYSFFNFSAR